MRQKRARFAAGDYPSIYQLFRQQHQSQADDVFGEDAMIDEEDN